MSGSSENTMVNLQMRQVNFHTWRADVSALVPYAQNTMLVYSFHSLPNLFQFSVFAAV